MRLSIATVLTATLAGTALAIPPSVKRGSPVAEASGFASQIKEGVHASQVENELYNILGGETVFSIEKTLGSSLGDRLISLSQQGTQSAAPQISLIQAIIDAIAKLTSGLGLDEVNAWLDHETGGQLTRLQDVIGISDLLRALGLA